MNYDEAMQYIKNTAKFGSNLGLSRTEKILELLGEPHKKLKCIHIAGTNGKGSTTAMVNSILISAGYRVGMYTSPFLEEFEERIQINSVNIPKDDLSRLVSSVSEAVEVTVSLGFDHPTEFEIITCAMFLYFYEKNVDYAVVEVGLGGRLDSTNVINPVLSVITSISFDHMAILGDTLGKIAFEKAGIIKRGVPVVLYPQEEESMAVIERVCNERESRMIKVHRDSVSFINSSGKRQRIRLELQEGVYDIELSLLGKHQLLNCATAVAAAEELRKQGAHIDKEDIERAVKAVAWPGRLEIMKEKPLVVIDGAHNYDGIAKLAESLETYFRYNKLILILGILADKEVNSMVEVIIPKASAVITVTPNSSRAELADELKRIVDGYGVPCEAIENYEAAYEKGLSMCGAGDLLLISGSLYMIGDMRKII